MIAFWVLRSQLTLTNSCSVPQSCDCVLQRFLQKMAKDAHWESRIHLMTHYLLNDRHKSGYKIKSGHVVTPYNRNDL